MPIRNGYEVGTILDSGRVTTAISEDLFDYEFMEWDPNAFYVNNLSGYSNGARFAAMAESVAAARQGYKLLNWSDDFYDRIYISPTFIDLGTIASPQTRTVELWNAWRYQDASLSSVDIDGTTVEVDGNLPPYDMRPLEFGVYTIHVPSTGTPSVNTVLTFNFSNVTDPAPVVIVGTRAVRFGVVPEVPVLETWSWYTDLMVATDGTEQRVAVRGEAPRVTLDINGLFLDQEEVDEFYAQLLTAAGRLWMPEYQYATTVTADAAPGDTVVHYEVGCSDIRDGEYVLFDTKAAVFMVEVATAAGGVITLADPLVNAVPKGSLVTSGGPCLLDDGSGLRRKAVDWVGSTELKCKMQRYRAALPRPEAATQLTYYKGSAVLERRALVPDDVNDNFFTGQEVMDNDTGVVDMITNWEYTRVAGQRQYKVNRVQDPADMDYWREFLAWCRGRARMFWLPSYRHDLQLLSPPSAGGDTCTIVGNRYALKLFNVPTHRHLEFHTAAGVFRCQVTNAVDVDGNSGITFTPGWPTGTLNQQVERVSLLLPCRLDSDDVRWEHYWLESLVNLSIRTAEDQDP